MATEFVNRLFRAVEGLLSIALLAVFAEVVIEVGARYLFHVPLPWGAEVSQTLLVWITFLGAGAALRRDEHMGVTLVLDALPRHVARILACLGNWGVLAFLVVGLISGYEVVLRTWPLRTTTLQLPAGVLYLAFPAGCLLMLLGLGVQRLLPLPRNAEKGEKRSC